MTDAHFHRGGRTIASLNGKEYIFCGIHPWLAASVDLTAELARFRTMLGTGPSLGVGEIGLDRLKDKNISPVQREVFAAQLELAAEMGRPVVLHGAKCWGEVVKAIRPYAGRIPAFLFHGFSRSDGLLPDIVKVNGFIGVGKAVLNDHAVNYRELAKKIPLDRMLIETDGEDLPDNERTALLAEILSKTAELTSVTESQIDSNMSVFISSLAMCRTLA
jgi:TatD DNase family protein